MAQQVRERFEGMRRVLIQDERDVLDSLELDLRRTRTRLDQVQRNWEQHEDQVAKNISSAEKAASAAAGESGTVSSVASFSPKKPDASEEEIRLDEESFERLLGTLSSVSRQLSAQLRRKTLLLDSSLVAIDTQTCHRQITVTPGGRGLSYAGAARASPEQPLQFDKVCCALGRSPLAASRSYWEVDVRCCLAWAVGVAYASLERKGRDKGAKLGRNRNSWCVELRNGRLCAWHNDRHVACQGTGHAPPRKIGVWVNYDKGQLAFHDADTTAVLQTFSAAVTPVFDRAHHRFTEPLYPAVRFLKPPERQMWPNHLELCHPVTP
ncbi:tripartite motif-containing protein 14 [Brachionichthys hirsutus]|uniref:tripartite motif-containing protein 14 n=1 Tax=Brachionichthys hirsutus TaxID=412623 RepID=UPI0036052133